MLLDCAKVHLKVVVLLEYTNILSFNDARALHCSYSTAFLSHSILIDFIAFIVARNRECVSFLHYLRCPPSSHH